MARPIAIAVVSDIHYASAAEKARGDGYELRAISNPYLRLALRAYRHFIWLRYPLQQNGLLDVFVEKARNADLVIANGDYSCDSAFVGLSDPAACQSARECLAKLRSKFREAFQATLGDHELGKFSFVGRRGGMRLASYRCAIDELALAPFWTREVGVYTLIGVTSSLIALPMFESEILPEERVEWERLRVEHVEQIRKMFSSLKPDQRVVLFCHDPTALPFLYAEEIVRNRLNQVEATVIGHLHSNLIFWKSRLLAGMPHIQFMGHSIGKMSRALNRARHWKPFHVQLCPSLAGSELLKDGGFLTLEIDPSGRHPIQLRQQRIPRIASAKDHCN